MLPNQYLLQKLLVLSWFQHSPTTPPTKTVIGLQILQMTEFPNFFETHRTTGTALSAIYARRKTGQPERRRSCKSEAAEAMVNEEFSGVAKPLSVAQTAYQEGLKDVERTRLLACAGMPRPCDCCLCFRPGSCELQRSNEATQRNLPA